MATDEKSKNTKKASEKKVAKKEAPAKVETKPEVKPAEASSKGSGQAVAIAILATALVFILLTFTVLLATGVIKFGSNNAPVAENVDDNGDSDGSTIKSDDGAKSGDIIDNPHKQIREQDATLAHVGDLEFYLPEEFEAGGKNKDGAYTYNLTDDDGWAQVLVYAEDTSLSPSAYLNKISSNLDITDRNYKMNGTSWVQAENANALAYATKLGDKVYAVYYAVKLDSDATSRAMQMIPKTLYMKKIIKE